MAGTEDSESGPDEQVADKKAYVVSRYKDSISYYWRASNANKRWYKWTRYLTVILGALVTLLASLTSSQSLSGRWSTLVAIMTPIMAAVLTVVGGLAQTFQWGAAWQEMVLTAERLERERDRVLVSQSDPLQDLEVLNRLVLDESTGFFTRVLGSVQQAPKGEAPSAS